MSDGVWPRQQKIIDADPPPCPPAVPIAELEEEFARVATEFPGWFPWCDLNGGWHARLAGTVPPAMVHAGSAGELREKIRQHAAP